MPYHYIQARASVRKFKSLGCDWQGCLTLSLRWGSPEFIGLGFLSFVTIIITELFGSPFLKNASIMVGLAMGCIVAGAAGYIDGSTITSTPTITFLWYVQRLFLACVILISRRVHTFKIGVYPPAILPMLAVYGRHIHIRYCITFPSGVSLSPQCLSRWKQ